MYADYTKETEEQLTVKKGDTVGLMEEDDFEVFWKVSSAPHMLSGICTHAD